MKPQLLPDPESHDLVEAFEHCAASARAGHVVGALLGLIVKGRRYHVHVVGSVARDPTFGRGVCAAIDDELMAMVHHTADHAQTR